MKYFFIFFLPVLFISEIKAETIAKKNIATDSIYNLDSSWINQDGTEIKLSNYLGKHVVISMVYLKCKFSCPLTVAQMKEVEKTLLPEIKNNTQFILVTFDTAHDSPKVMLKYAQKNKIPLSNWTFLTAKNESSVRQLSTLIDFKYKKLESGEFEHSYAIIALDKEGRIIGRTEGSEMMPTLISDLLNKAKTIEQNNK